MTMRSKSISIVVPAYNKEDGTGDFLLATSKTLKSEPVRWECIVVDNGSSDSTCGIVERFTSERHTESHCFETNQTEEKAIRFDHGMLEAQYDTRLMCDADCASSLESLGGWRWPLRMRKSLLVRGSPRAVMWAASSQFVGRIVGTAFLILTKSCSPGTLPHDVYCEFKLWTAEAAEAVFPVVTLDGWVFDAEALALGKKFGFDIAEVGIHWIDRPNSRLSIRAVLIPAVTELVRARRSVRRALTPASN